MGEDNWSKAELYVLETLKRLDTAIDEMKSMLEKSLTSFKKDILDEHNRQYQEVNQEVSNLKKIVYEVKNKQIAEDGVNSGKKLSFTMAIAVFSLIMGMLGLILDWVK